MATSNPVGLVRPPLAQKQSTARMLLSLISKESLLVARAPDGTAPCHHMPPHTTTVTPPDATTYTTCLSSISRRCLDGGLRYEFEERDGLRLKYLAGEPGKYVGVKERKGKRKQDLVYDARASVTKRKGDASSTLAYSP